MQNASSYKVTIGVAEDGKYVAISTSSPQFCLIADTEADVLAKAERAIYFYRESLNVVREVKPARQFALQPFIPTRSLDLPVAMPA